MKKKVRLAVIVASVFLLLPAFVFAGGKQEGTSMEKATDTTTSTAAADAAMAELKLQEPEEGWAFDLVGATPVKKDGKVPDGAYKKDPPWTIGFVCAGFGNSWRVEAVELIKLEAAKNPNIKELIVTVAEWDANRQLANIEDLIAQGVDAIILDVMSYGMADELVKKAMDAGILVVDSFLPSQRVEPADRLGFYTLSYKFGYAGGRWLNAKLGGKGKIWALRGIAGHYADDERFEGAMAAMDSGIEVVEEIYGDWGYDKAKQGIEALIMTNPDIDGIWSSGADMTRAAIDVFKENGIDMVPMTGESLNGFYRAWLENDVDSAGVYFNCDLWVSGFRYMVALLEGQPGLYKHYEHQPDVILKSDLDWAYRPDLNDSYWTVSNDTFDTYKDWFMKTYKK